MKWANEESSKINSVRDYGSTKTCSASHKSARGLNEPNLCSENISLTEIVPEETMNNKLQLDKSLHVVMNPHK